MKIGIFGGTFNPPHMGHIVSMQTVQKKLGLGIIYMVPTSKNPLKLQTEGPSPEERLRMCELAVESFKPALTIDATEINKGGTNYTIDSLKEFVKRHPNDDLFLVIGMDQLEDFYKWKSWNQIIEISNLVVTSRPGYELPRKLQDLPQFLQNEISEMEFNTLVFKSGKSAEFIQLNDLDISSSQIRKFIRTNKNTQKYLPLSVETYIREKKLYSGINKGVKDFKKFTAFCGQILNEKKAVQVMAYDIRKSNAIAEYAIITSGTSTRHTSALAENLTQAVKEEFNIYPQNIEGTQEGRWVVLDYGQLVVHVFYDFVRQEYSIEKLWADCVELDLQ